MKFFQLCLVACSLVSVALAGADLDKYRKDGYFGKQNVPKNGPYPADNEAIRPFNISVPHPVWQMPALLTTFPGTAFRYGMNPEELKKVVQYWNSTYDWRQQEAWLNSYPQYLTQIEGLDVHYVHVKAKENASTSFEMLTTPDASGIAFEVIAPSIPGFGYGEGAHREGMENTAMARIFTKLMARLGHSKYMLQGGDWGSAITRAMAIMYPEKAMGIHVLGVFDALENLLSPERLARVGLKQLLPNLSTLKSLKDFRGLTGLFDLNNLENQPMIVAMKSMLSETDRKKLFPLKEKAGASL
ncbi:epoxide hydrolase [Tyrophagus putrescentiae]|nr:epoxide hydrolase [Tyrophagus putrescentiae]